MKSFVRSSNQKLPCKASRSLRPQANSVSWAQLSQPSYSRSGSWFVTPKTRKSNLVVLSIGPDLSHERKKWIFTKLNQWQSPNLTTEIRDGPMISQGCGSFPASRPSQQFQVFSSPLLTTWESVRESTYFQSTTGFFASFPCHNVQ